MVKHAQFLQVPDLGNIEEVTEDKVSHVHPRNDGLGVKDKLKDKTSKDFLET